ncbi:hypothetical protein E2C01_059915 [Portunus trituberculatus]|uniref:Uncharacterized protein n=1 Tax=Portunus trituberculatus TaxID=210409 RepID=A0A5B7H7I3_PORTR|nr:hypothetical protein [Portunus trituberculatus]
MLRKAEKDGEQIEDPSGQHANPPYKPLLTKKTMGMIIATSKVLTEIYSQREGLTVLQPPDGR